MIDHVVVIVAVSAHVIVTVIAHVIAAVIDHVSVAVHVHGNDTVIVICPVDGAELRRVQTGQMGGTLGTGTWTVPHGHGVAPGPV